MSAAGESKTKAREAALQMLYALELGGQDAAQIERWYLAAHPLPPAVRERAGALVDAAVGHREQIEDLIRRHARGWRLERISVIDRSLLKLAAAELLLRPAPSLGVVVQACLDLARKFSQPDALKFLHGLLDAMARDMAGAPVQDAAPATVEPD